VGWAKTSPPDMPSFSETWSFVPEAGPAMTISQIQQVSEENLIIADQNQDSAPYLWTLQASPNLNQFVFVVARCLYPPMPFGTAEEPTLTACDTAPSPAPWNGITM